MTSEKEKSNSKETMSVSGLSEAIPLPSSSNLDEIDGLVTTSQNTEIIPRKTGALIHQIMSVGFFENCESRPGQHKILLRLISGLSHGSVVKSITLQFENRTLSPEELKVFQLSRYRGKYLEQGSGLSSGSNLATDTPKLPYDYIIFDADGLSDPNNEIHQIKGCPIFLTPYGMATLEVVFNAFETEEKPQTPILSYEYSLLTAPNTTETGKSEIALLSEEYKFSYLK